MDILIKGMEMPKSCYSEVYSENGFCPFHCFDYHGGSHCTMSDCKCLKTRRPEDCPLIPVPEHGDLIDRDAVLNELKKYYKVGEIAEVGEVACFISDAEVVLERTT